MKKTLTILFALATMTLTAQTTENFENFNIGLDSAMNGSTMNGGFTISNAYLHNSYNPAWNAWNGWSISSKRDTVTAGYTNDLSSVTGGGYNSPTYAIAYTTSGSHLDLTGMAAGGIVNGFYITNGTYTYLSMRDGDGIAKKFGGITGDDPDYFLLTIKKYYNGVLASDSVNFYLADFRFTDNSQDYIVKDWQYVDLTSLGDVDSLVFSMSSTDNGAFGMNTPAYFCMDDFTTADYTVSTDKITTPTLNIFPNPTTDFIQVDGIETLNSIYSIIDLNGRVVQNATFTNNQIEVGHLPKGTYVLSIETEVGKVSQLFIKR